MRHAPLRQPLGHLGRWGLLAVIVGMAGCAAQARTRALEAPVMVEPVLDIPVDLDAVVRVDVERLRGAVPLVIFEPMMNLLFEGLGGAAFAASARESRLMYLGLRPTGLTSTSAPLAMDYVVVLENTGANSDRSWTLGFNAPRDLGGAYFRHDAKVEGPRFAPARVYERWGQRLTVTSAAEVDATERVIERHVRNRETVPEDRGVISFHLTTARVVALIDRGSPHFARLLARTERIQGFFDINQEACSGTVRADFGLPSEAERVQSALRVVLGLFDTKDSSLEVEVEVVEAEVVVRLSAGLGGLMELIGMRPSDG